MICPICNHENAPDAEFCGGCGQSLSNAASAETAQPAPQAEMQAQPAYDYNTDSADNGGGIGGTISNLPVKTVFKIAIPVILVIIALSVVSNLLFPNFYYRKDTLAVMSDGDETIVMTNKKKAIKIDGTCYDYTYSRDFKRGVVLTQESDDEDGGTLWAIAASGSKPKKLATDVLGYAYSDSGKGLVYWTDRDNKDNTVELLLIKGTSKPKSIAKDVPYTYASSSILSPDGKTVAFVSDYDSKDNEITSSVSVNGKKPEKLGDDIQVLKITNNAKLIYFSKETDKSESVRVRNKSGSKNTKLHDGGYLNGIFNKDCTEYLYTDDGRTYYSKNGKSGKKLDGKYEARSIVPPENVYAVRTLKNNLLSDSDTMLWFNGKELRKVVSGVSEGYISKNKKVFTFIKGDSLCIINPKKKNAERKELDEDKSISAYDFKVADDGKIKYYVKDNELWIIKGTGKPKRIFDDKVSEMASVKNGKALFFISDKQLYYTSGGKAKEIKNADDVTGVATLGKAVLYQNKDGDTYRSNGSKKFKLFKEGDDDSSSSRSSDRYEDDDDDDDEYNYNDEIDDMYDECYECGGEDAYFYYEDEYYCYDCYTEVVDYDDY